MSSNPITKAIEAATRRELAAAEGDRGPRYHLGASIIGDRCARKVFYKFRGALEVDHTGRLRRLFTRGHEEEFRLSRWLRMSGFEVRDYAERLCLDQSQAAYRLVDWETPLANGMIDVSKDPYHIQLAVQSGVPLKQHGFKALCGHYAGSCDAFLRATDECSLVIGEDIPDGWGLAEFKTHNVKSFQQLKLKGLATSKPTHYVQMQIYMHAKGLAWGLYVAVNKNDDELYTEVVFAKRELAEQYFHRAVSIVESVCPPKRLSEDASWWECTFCDFREVCHYGKAPQKGCRTCVMARANTDEGGWYCKRFHSTIPTQYLGSGCEAWEAFE